MADDRWRMGFHLMPPIGWLNDPNGLCQLNGVYHVFHQYSPDWPQPGAPRGWGHATSTDLAHWEHHGMVISPDTPDEASGSYSGCALVMPKAAPNGSDAVRFYYTGNVKEQGDFDYILTGRRATQILIESDDGFAMGDKQVLLRNADYPAFCSCHVRDPKVWRDADGTWWMILGARDVESTGLVLVLRSEDGYTWENAHQVRSDAPFGFMWECPDRVVLDGNTYLSCCPQGMQAYPWSHGLRDQAGYFPLPAGCDLSDADSAVRADEFALWDNGFDFYAPQTFTDAQGRTLLIAWMGMPEAPYVSAPNDLTWCHCLTVPRVLSRLEDGSIAQQPAPELKALRGEKVELAGAGTSALLEHRADIEVDGIDGPFFLTLDDALEIAYDGSAFTLRFLDTEGVGAGRTFRNSALEALHDLRVLVDDSAVEVFANGGRLALATRWFPTADALRVSLEGTCSVAVAWPMGDGVRITYTQ